MVPPPDPPATPDPTFVLGVLHETCDAVRAALDATSDWGLAGTRSGQYRSDLAADAAALEVLAPHGWAVLSEESGITGLGETALHATAPGVGALDVGDLGEGLLIVIDPVDGSTNASRGIPWYATAVCAVDDEGPLVAVVCNQATGARFEAVRGGGARLDGVALTPSSCSDLSEALIGLTAWPRQHLGWRQFRAMGAAALDICAVAAGVTDGFLDCTPKGIHGVWDYLAAFLVCTEAGGVVGEATGRDWMVRDPAERRAPVAAASPALFAELEAAHAEHLTT